VKIGLVTDFYHPWIGGPSILVCHLGHGLAARGHSVSLLAPSPSGQPYRELDGSMAVTRARTMPSPFGFNLRVHPPVGGAVERWLDDARPDVVHVHHPFPLSARAVFAARRRGIPVVATNHTVPECSLWGIRQYRPLYGVAQAAFGWWLIYLLNRCTRVATPTRTAADALSRLGFLGEIVPISNGVDIQRFSPGPPDMALRRRLGLDDRPVVLYTGRLDAEKQMDVWLDAAALVLRHGEAQFVVGGRGTDAERLMERMRRLGIEQAVHFIGYLPDDEYPTIYRLADVYFITSPVELQSITTLEAVSSGLPVVGVRAQALPELVHDDWNGYCVQPGNAIEAAGQLTRLLSDATARAGMGRRSREIALGHNLEESVAAYETLLHDAWATRRGRLGYERTPALGG
jgi:1,2-diacylglycerol 3-alpha-glucosyltransferase